MLYTGRVETKSGVLNVRSAPGGAVVGMLVSGDEVQVLSDEGAWVTIPYGSSEGYVSKQYIIFQQAATDVRLVVTDEEGHAVAIGSEATVRIAAGAID